MATRTPAICLCLIVNGLLTPSCVQVCASESTVRIHVYVYMSKPIAQRVWG